MTEAEQRVAVVKEALSWEGTKFAHGQCVKGLAADCSTFIAACFRSVGIFRAAIPHLPADWFVHTTKEEYLTELLKHAVEFDPKLRIPQPADIMIVKDTALAHGKVFSHGAIVVQWPMVIHCFPPCVMRSNARSYPAFQHRALRYFNPWGISGTRD